MNCSSSIICLIQIIIFVNDVPGSVYFPSSLLPLPNFCTFEIICEINLTDLLVFFRFRNISRTDRRYGSYIAKVHDSLLKKVLKGETYLKLYSYHYLINGFAVLVTQQQV